MVHMIYGLNLGWGGPIGDYIGFWGYLFEGYIVIYYKFSPGLIYLLRHVTLVFCNLAACSKCQCRYVVYTWALK